MNNTTEKIRFVEFKIQRCERQFNIVRKLRTKFFEEGDRAKFLRWGSIGADIYNQSVSAHMQLEELEGIKNDTQ